MVEENLHLRSTFNEGIYAYFGGYLNEKISENLIKRTHEDGLNQLDNWCKTNKLEEKIWNKNEPKQCRGYIILGSFYPEGELNMDSTVGEVNLIIILTVLMLFHMK